jgi:hypothetical protein
LPVSLAETPHGYEGLVVELPENSTAFFIWSKMNEGDFHFRLARFWENESPNSLEICPNLPQAIGKVREIVKASRLS